MMGRKLDQVLVVDVESTCWSGPAPEGQISEIIEIGVCTLDIHTGDRENKRSILVQPEQSRVSEFCTQLTTLTQKVVTSQGISFADACAILRDEYRSTERVWASYGDYDRQMFQRQCDARDIEYPFNSRHINVKTLFALSRALPYEVGMTRALQLLKLQQEGRAHRGDDDAWNIARILSELLLKNRTKPRPKVSNGMTDKVSA